MYLLKMPRLERCLDSMQGTLQCLAHVCMSLLQIRDWLMLNKVIVVSCVSHVSMHDIIDGIKASLPSGSVLSDCCVPFTLYSQSAHSKVNLQVPAGAIMLPCPQLLLLRFITC